MHIYVDGQNVVRSATRAPQDAAPYLHERVGVHIPSTRGESFEVALVSLREHLRQQQCSGRHHRRQNKVTPETSKLTVHPTGLVS